MWNGYNCESWRVSILSPFIHQGYHNLQKWSNLSRWHICQVVVKDCKKWPYSFPPRSNPLSQGNFLTQAIWRLFFLLHRNQPWDLLWPTYVPETVFCQSWSSSGLAFSMPSLLGSLPWKSPHAGLLDHESFMAPGSSITTENSLPCHKQDIALPIITSLPIWVEDVDGQMR